MSRVGLKQLFGRASDTRAVLSTIATALGETVVIEDQDGRVLHGEPLLQANGHRFPVTLEGRGLGWVSGGERAETVAAVLMHLVAKEVERKALGAEVLHLYREVNLIYSFSEKLAALLDLERVARLTLQEARHLIVATDGVILVLDDDTGDLSPIAGFGDDLPALGEQPRGRGIIGTIVATGIAEIVDDVAQDPRGRAGDVRSLIAAPLKVGERIIGAIALASTVPLAYTAGELKLLSTLALQTATAIENARLFERTVQASRERERLLAANKEMEVARAKLESEMDLAARIQADLFPATLPRVDGYDLAARNRSARQCGGDYYDALPIASADGHQRWLLCVADVSGKGLPAALVMSNMQATLRALIGRITSLPDLATFASELLHASTASDRYVTAALVELTAETGSLQYLSAGHVAGLLLRATGEAVTLESTGLPLGLLPGVMPYDRLQLAIERGDCLVLFSDGVVEAQDPAGTEFGEARVTEIVRGSMDQPAAAIVARLFEAIDGFAGSAPQYDDITMLVLRRD